MRLRNYKYGDDNSLNFVVHLYQAREFAQLCELVFAKDKPHTGGKCTCSTCCCSAVSAQPCRPQALPTVLVLPNSPKCDLTCVMLGARRDLLNLHREQHWIHLGTQITSECCHGIHVPAMPSCGHRSASSVVTTDIEARSHPASYLVTVWLGTRDCTTPCPDSFTCKDETTTESSSPAYKD